MTLTNRDNLDSINVRFEDDPAMQACSCDIGLVTAATLLVIGWILGAACVGIVWWVTRLWVPGR